MSYFYSVQDSRARAGTRVFCKKCQKETAFYRRSCLECGTQYVKKWTGGKSRTWTMSLKHGLQKANLRDDRVAYWKRKAEESRAKFESPKKNLPDDASLRQLPTQTSDNGATEVVAHMVRK